MVIVGWVEGIETERFYFTLGGKLPSVNCDGMENRGGWVCATGVGEETSPLLFIFTLSGRLTGVAVHKHEMICETLVKFCKPDVHFIA